MTEKYALQVLQKYFGYSSFRPGQEQVVQALLTGQDSLSIMPTGAGKSICFQVPALVRRGMTLVFTPLISLMKDQVDGLLLQHIPATYINSTLSPDEFKQRLAYIREGQIKLLYLAPERLESDWFCQLLRELPIGQVVIDEAHCVSQWGHDFRPAYKLIAPFLKTLPRKPVVGAFTATATIAVEEDMKRLLGLETAKLFITGFDRPNLAFRVMHMSNRLDFIHDYVHQHAEENGVIYCATRKDVETVYQSLIKSGVKAGYYHAGLSDDLRREQQNLYAYDKVSVMVATNAFGMGIDKSNVRYVLHYQMPRNMESYYQEAGRAGRDGGESECILLYNGRDVMIHKYLIEQSIEEPQRRQVELDRLQKMIDYCFCATCLRKYILRYFGEEVPWETCGHCSSCQDKVGKVNLTREAKYIFRAIRATEERYGTSMIADIVGGVQTDRIHRFKYDALPMFGSLAKLDEKEIKGLIRQLVASGFIHSTTGKYPILGLTAAAEDVLDGLKEIEQIRPTVARAPKRKMAKQRPSGLFEHLRNHRKLIAEKVGVPPYLIFPDTVLIDMVTKKPKTLADLYEIKGIGEVKLRNYGLSFLQAISEYKER